MRRVALWEDPHSSSAAFIKFLENCVEFQRKTMASKPFAGKFSSDCASLPRSDPDTENAGGEHDHCITSRVPLQRKVKQRSRFQRDETRTPLLQQDEENRGSDEAFVRVEGDESDEINRPSTNNTERFCGVVLFLVFLVVGLTLLVSVNVKSDVTAHEIKPKHFHYYKIALIVIFIACLIFKCRHNCNGVVSDGDFEPLIPSHLLTGLALFGVAYSALEVVVITDFVKCSRSVTGLDGSYVASAIFEMVFVFCQIYTFYSLSRRRKQILWFGSLFTMFTLAINLTLWAGYFCAGAVDHPDLKNVTWLRRYHYGMEEDVCRFNNTGNYSRKLHVELMPEIRPYKYTFAMEYSLLASALLLHVWLEIATPSAGEFDTTNKKWEVWRFGFIVGLFSLPLMGCMGVYSTARHTLSNSAYLFAIQFVVMILIFLVSAGGLWLLRKYYKRRRNTKVLKVDIILLCFSALGFVVLDLFTAVASLLEILKTYDTDFLVMGLTLSGELVCISVLTVFVFASYFYQMRPCGDGIRAAKYVRQIASFCITVNFGFWAIRTYTFRSKYSFDFVGHQYFGPTAWFVITQVSTPMIIFYHFHCAVCLTGIIAKSS